VVQFAVDGHVSSTVRLVATKLQAPRQEKEGKEWSLQVSSLHFSVYSTARFDPALGVYSALMYC
jgi:hypothetical protein